VLHGCEEEEAEDSGHSVDECAVGEVLCDGVKSERAEEDREEGILLEVRLCRSVRAVNQISPHDSEVVLRLQHAYFLHVPFLGAARGNMLIRDEENVKERGKCEKLDAYYLSLVVCLEWQERVCVSHPAQI